MNTCDKDMQAQPLRARQTAVGVLIVEALIMAAIWLAMATI